MKQSLKPVAHFVLIHGAMHGGWCWERLAPLLAHHGHAVSAPDLPGLGADRTPAAEVTLEHWARFIADIINESPGPVILVGHSLGGAAISQAAERAPERIAVLVYLTALLLRDGQSAADLPQESSALNLTLSPDGHYVTVNPQNALTAFYGETANEWRDRAVHHLVPQPVAILGAKLNLTAARHGAVSRVYIECLRDRAITLAAQRAMQAASPCALTLEIDTDHSPFYSAPATLAAHLLRIADEYT